MMPCYNPIDGYWSKEVGESGKRRVVFDVSQGFRDRPIRVPCGQCIGCRLERSRQWALRCLHEASLYEDNSFVTLTYNDANLPSNLSLVKDAFPKFVRSLRKRTGETVRYFHCGEYGEKFLRPHYHALLFGYWPPDTKLYKVRDGVRLYCSEFLSEVWNQGFVSVGEVTFESAAYVARYCTKKVTGSKASEHYERVTDGGELVQVEPEFCTMSRRPGIGKDWFDKFREDCYPSDFITVRGKKCKPPRFYDEQLQKVDTAVADAVKMARLVQQRNAEAEERSIRLYQRNEVKKAQANLLKRSYEDGSEDC